MAETPRAGDLFEHGSFLDPDWTPGPGQRHADAPKAICVVTTVRRGSVYYNYVRTPPSAPSAFKVGLAEWPGRHTPLPFRDDWSVAYPDGTTVDPERYRRWTTSPDVLH